MKSVAEESSWVFLLPIAGLLYLLLPSSAAGQEASHRCEDYATQGEAQAAFDRDPDRLWELDDDGDGIACEHLPVAEDDGASPIFPWLAGGVLIAGGAAGVLLARKRASRQALSPSPPAPVSTHPEYDPEVELELELIKAEQDAEDAAASGKIGPDEKDPGRDARSPRHSM